MAKCLRISLTNSRKVSGIFVSRPLVRCVLFFENQKARNPPPPSTSKKRFILGFFKNLWPPCVGPLQSGVCNSLVNGYRKKIILRTFHYRPIHRRIIIFQTFVLPIIVFIVQCARPDKARHEWPMPTEEGDEAKARNSDQSAE